MNQNLLAAAIETPHTLRWAVKVGRATFEVYVDKWAVPRPWPAEITVYISAGIDSRGRVPKDLGSLDESSLVVEFKYTSDRDNYAVFEPLGDRLSSPIRTTYIPFELLPDGDYKTLWIAVEWTSTGPGVFRRQPDKC